MNKSVQLEIHPVNPTFGAEITDLDLSQPLSPGQSDAIYDALITHSVMFFRDQPIKPAQHMALDKDKNNPPDTEGWHADVTDHADPPFVSLLAAPELPPVGGDTLWASLFAALASLPEAMKQWLPELHAVRNMGDFNFGLRGTWGSL